jgi:hypothetical protein
MTRNVDASVVFIEEAEELDTRLGGIAAIGAEGKSGA